MLAKRDLDFPEFDAKPADLHLIVARPRNSIFPSDKWRAMSPVLYSLAPGSRAKGVRNKFLRGQIGAVEISSRQTHPADVQVTGDTDGHKVKHIIDNIYARVRYRSSDRNCRIDHLAAFAQPIRRVDNCLGWSVHVIQTCLGALMEAHYHFGWQSFPTAHDGIARREDLRKRVLRRGDARKDGTQ